jgi:glutathione S-transferase
MITVHHLDNSRSQRILWLLEELGVPYEVKYYKRQPNLLAPPELKKIHPLGKAPVIQDKVGQDEGRVIAETGAIIEYLVDSYGPHLKPPVGTADRMSYTYWMHYAEGSAMTPLLIGLVADGIRQHAPVIVKPVAIGIARALEKSLVTANLAAHIQFWEDALAQSPWFAGYSFSAADIMMSFPLEAAASRARAAEKPHIREWLETIHVRPAYQRALERGGAYAFV